MIVSDEWSIVSCDWKLSQRFETGNLLIGDLPIDIFWGGEL